VGQTEFSAKSSSGQAIVSGTTLKLEGTTLAELKSGTLVNITGTLVKIN
jgi:hypothetical protein